MLGETKKKDTLMNSYKEDDFNLFISGVAGVINSFILSLYTLIFFDYMTNLELLLYYTTATIISIGCVYWAITYFSRDKKYFD